MEAKFFLAEDCLQDSAPSELAGVYVTIVEDWGHTCIVDILRKDFHNEVRNYTAYCALG